MYKVLLVDDEALTRDDVPDLTKKLIACALSEKEGWEEIPFQSTTKNQHLYGRR